MQLKKCALCIILPFFPIAEGYLFLSYVTELYHARIEVETIKKQAESVNREYDTIPRNSSFSS